jgi:hypothetical protein
MGPFSVAIVTESNKEMKEIKNKKKNNLDGFNKRIE